MSLGLLTSSIRVLKNLKDVQYERVLGQISARFVDKDGDFSHIVRRKRRLELVLLSCAVCGIEFCYAAETAFVSPTLLKIGVPVVYMTLIWCLSPFLGLFLVPLFGSLSDRCKSRMGRRRPFILALSLGIVFGLLLVPNGKDIGRLLGDQYLSYANSYHHGNNDSTTPGPWTHSARNTNDSTTAGPPENATVWAPPSWNATAQPHPWGVLFTVIGVVLLDFSCDSCQSPCRAYLLDVCIPEDHSPGLSTFTIMAGLGGSLGYVIGGFNWRSTTFGESLGDHVRVVFSLVLVIYIVCLLLTVSAVKEVPLDKLGATAELLQAEKKRVGSVKYRKFANESDDDGDGDGGLSKASMTSYGSRDRTVAAERGSRGFGEETEPNAVKIGEPEASLESYQLEDRKCVENGRPPPLGEITLPLQSEVTLKVYLISIVRMPRSLAILCVTNLFCWMSLVCYSLYFTDFVGQAVYGGDPMAAPDTRQHQLYEQGVRTGSLAMSLYSFSCAVYSMSIERLVRRFRARPVYIISQLVYTFGAALMAITRSKIAVIALSPCAGVMYATLFTMPYLLVAHYHSNEQFEEKIAAAPLPPPPTAMPTATTAMPTATTATNTEIPKQIRGLGTDIALVSSMVFFAQFLLSACMGAIVHRTGTTASVMAAASVLSFCGSLCATKVLYLDL